MLDIRKLDHTLSVCPQISATELIEIAERGFRSVINNRPDGEAVDQPDSSVLAQIAQTLDLEYRHIPVLASSICASSVQDFRTALAQLPGPILAFCRSGTRSASLWALASDDTTSTEQIIRTAATAGYDLQSLRARLAATEALDRKP
jgi:sulfide:quinone oxidoreductase